METLHILLDHALSSKKYGSVIVHFTYFKNTLKQIPTALLVYPFTQEAFTQFMTSIEIPLNDAKPVTRENTYEPSHKAVKKKLLHMMSEIMMHGAILHHKTSEFAARMMAMKSSKDNATQIIQDLTVQYNKIRQDTITKEIVEIV
jgi:F-type H+-transporting ATPase subunit gamma